MSWCDLAVGGMLTPERRGSVSLLRMSGPCVQLLKKLCAWRGAGDENRRTMHSALSTAEATPGSLGPQAWAAPDSFRECVRRRLCPSLEHKSRPVLCHPSNGHGDVSMGFRNASFSHPAFRQVAVKQRFQQWKTPQGQELRDKEVLQSLPTD